MDIIYRCSEDILTRNYRPKGTLPKWLDKRKCFKSFINSLKSSHNNHTIYIIHDGPFGPLEEYIKSFNINIQNINYSNPANSLLFCLNFGKSLKNDNIYFLEDDYLHLPNAINILEEGIEKFQLISGYDHPDRYTRIDDITYKQEEISITKSSHWRTAEATTHTFIVSKNISEIVIDEAIKFPSADREFFRNLYKTKNIRLWQTIPGVITHVTNMFSSPLINWKEFNDSIIL
jgi:hypothetical protein